MEDRQSGLGFRVGLGLGLGYMIRVRVGLAIGSVIKAPFKPRFEIVPSTAGDQKYCNTQVSITFISARLVFIKL